MAFFKFRKAGDDTAAAPAQPESIETLRRRARHRLIGAAVLVLLGVIGFPVLFDTQPRPVAVDIPIEIPDRNKARPLSPPAPVAQGQAREAPGAAPAGGKASPPAPVAQGQAREAPGAAPAGGKASLATPVAQGQAREEPPAAPAGGKASPAASPAPSKAPVAAGPVAAAPTEADRPESRAPAQAAGAAGAADGAARPASVTAPPPAPPAVAEAAKAQALLEGKQVQAAAQEALEGRFVVQVGAFADAVLARETRQKVEKAGLKTYTQVAETKDGKRIRVRVGPFASRAEADKAAGRIKELDLPANVLTL